MIALKEYIGILVIEIIICGVFIFIGFRLGHFWPVALAIPSFIPILATLHFFRDPERSIPPDNGIVLSPADGKVIRIRQHQEDVFCQAQVTTIFIFLRLWDVHVNRMPVAGKVNLLVYRQGKFHAAMFDKASANNEQMQIGILQGQDRFLIKQVAGMIARRIVCRVKLHDTVIKGQRFGLIKFGSLVELSMPAHYQLTVQLNQIVKAGETIVGILERK